MLQHHQWLIRGVICVATLLAAVTAWSQGPGGFARVGQRGGARSLSALLTLPEVTKEIRVDDEQQRAIEALHEDTRKQTSIVFTSADGGQPVSPHEFREKLATIEMQADEKVKTLLKPEQFERLCQLQLQAEGVTAFRRPEIADKLGLTNEQRTKLSEIIDRGRSEFGPPQPNTQSKTDALALLTAEQKDRWSVLVGKEVTLPSSFGLGGFGPRGGPMGGEETKVLARFDVNKDKQLNREERKAARAFLAERPQQGRRGPGGFGRWSEPVRPGPHVSSSDVPSVSAEVPLYDPKTVRTLFLDFDNADWEAELEDFHNTDADVPATLTVDGNRYLFVGVRFRGMSSYGGVGRGSKRSLNISLDAVDSKQRLLGYKTLNLLNSHEDPTFLHTVLYSQFAREHIPAPKANFVKLVINGESWGVYVNAQQFDKIFTEENFHSKGARWKVRGSPGGDGGLNYVGDKVDDYKRRYEIKSDDEEKSWQALITLCRTLNETPLEQLEATLEPLLDLDGVFWFLAFDNALVNGDGYWTRASDYSLFLDERGKFHVIPHDMNETFHSGGGGPGFGPLGFGPPGFGVANDVPEQHSRRERAEEQVRTDPKDTTRNRTSDSLPQNDVERQPRAPGDVGSREAHGERDDRSMRFMRGPGGLVSGGPALDPLVGMNDIRKPLRSRLLAVPNLRRKYLVHVREIAQNHLDWNKLAPILADYEKLISKDLEADTRKLTSLAAFKRSIASAPPNAAGAGHNSLHSFADARRKYLLEYVEPKMVP